MCSLQTSRFFRAFAQPSIPIRSFVTSGANPQGKEGHIRRTLLGLKRQRANAEGVLHDSPDFRFADGRPAPETPTQLRWKSRRKREEERKVKLVEEMKEDIKNGNLQQFF